MKEFKPKINKFKVAPSDSNAAVVAFLGISLPPTQLA